LGRGSCGQEALSGRGSCGQEALSSPHGADWSSLSTAGVEPCLLVLIQADLYVWNVLIAPQAS
jgi:hypothetical protein